MGFLVIGHTHENINESFKYLSKFLTKRNNYVMVNLMEAFMFSQDHPFISHFIEEIHDFKSWVNGYLNDGLDVLVSRTKMHLFWFFMDQVRLPRCNIKYLLLTLCGALKMAWPYNCGKKMALDRQTYCEGFESCSISSDMGN